MAAKSRKSKQVILLFFCPESGRKEGAHLPCPHCKITIIKGSVKIISQIITFGAKDRKA